MIDNRQEQSWPPKAPSQKSSPSTSTKLNESETWTKAADVVRVSDETGDVCVAYLGGNWVLPNVSERGEENTAEQLPDRWNAFRTVPPPFGLSLCLHLVAAFVENFLPVFPMVDQQDFETRIRARTLPPVLLDVVCLAGASHCDRLALQNAGSLNRKDAIQTLYNRALASLDAHGGVETLTLVQCMFIMQFSWRSPTDWKDTKFWLSAAIREAQRLGLQKESELQKVDAPKQDLCRRLWWSLYVSIISYRYPILTKDTL